MESILSNIQSAGIFIAVLSILIIVHEWGHFITAKWHGVEVERFAIGFGPTIFSIEFHGTKYMLNIIPLGGYVKMAGDERTQCTGKPGEYFSKPVGKRALIVLNGPVVNYILAYVCLVFVFMLGFPDFSNKIGQLSEGYPAQTAGLREGDRIIEINSNEIENWTDIQNSISETKADQIQIRIMRDGQAISKVIVPKIEMTRNIFGDTEEIRLIGIRPAEEILTFQYGAGTSIVKAYQKLVEITTMTYRAIYSMIIGSMPAKENVTGPIGIFYIVKRAAELGMSHLLFILGVISASLAIFNLLPIIPLDGGHLLLMGIEKIRGKALSPKTDEYISRIGLGLIILLALFVIYSDITKMLDGTFK